MRGNSHVQFLMGKAAVTPLTYITIFNKQSYLIYEKIYFTSIDNLYLHQFTSKSKR